MLYNHCCVDLYSYRQANNVDSSDQKAESSGLGSNLPMSNESKWFPYPCSWEEQQSIPCIYIMYPATEACAWLIGKGSFSYRFQRLHGTLIWWSGQGGSRGFLFNYAFLFLIQVVGRDAVVVLISCPIKQGGIWHATVSIEVLEQQLGHLLLVALLLNSSKLGINLWTLWKNVCKWGLWFAVYRNTNSSEHNNYAHLI